LTNKEYKLQLELFDWNYYLSDDSNRVKQGEIEYNRLRELSKQSISKTNLFKYYDDKTNLKT
jgi:hypothetical protein